MDKEFRDYITEDGKFNQELYYKEIIEGANKIFTELFGAYSCSQVKNIIQSYTIQKSNRSIFRKSSLGWIYFVRDKNRGLVKIGMTDDVPSRLSQFKTSYKFCGLKSDLELIALCATPYQLRTVEKYFHDMFKEYHSYMEWFEIKSFTLIELLQNYILKKEYSSKNINDTLVFLMNDKNDISFKANFTEELPRKKLDPFYLNKIISVMESHALNTKYDKLYDVIMDEVEEMYIEGFEVDFKQAVGRIEKKYLDLEKNFFERVEMEKNILLKVK